MKSTTMRVRRTLTVAVIAVLAVAVGAITTINIKSIPDKASADTTKVEVKIRGESVPPSNIVFSPKHGPSNGGTLMTFNGNDMDGITEITIGGAECKPLNIISSEEVTCTTTAHVSGLTDIIITYDEGAGSIELDSAFTYDPILPEIPGTGGEDGGGLFVPGTGFFFFGSSESITFLDIILISFLAIAILGIVLLYLCIPSKRKKAKKSNSKKRPSTKKKR